MNVYTVRLLAGAIPTKSHLSSVCPAGHAWIIRDVSGVLYTAQADAGVVQISLGGVPVAIATFPGAGYVNMHWVGYARVMPGEEVRCDNTTVAPQTIFVTGYDFAL